MRIRAGQKHERYQEGDATSPSARQTVWFLTQNPDKLREAKAILAPYGIQIRQLNRPKIEIQDIKPENIAKYALQEALKHDKRLLLVEDSGLFVDTLRGFPGPFSSYVLDTIGLNGILDLLGNKRQRRAHFQSSVAVASPNLPVRVFTGRVNGRISNRILGSSGFGYDPIFIPDGFQTTFGLSTDAFKNATSHRSRAFQKFARWYNSTSRGVKIRSSKRALK